MLPYLDDVHDMLQEVRSNGGDAKDNFEAIYGAIEVNYTEPSEYLKTIFDLLGTWYYIYENWTYAAARPNTYGEYVEQQLVAFPQMLPYLDDVHDMLLEVRNTEGDGKQNFENIFGAIGEDFTDNPEYLKVIFDLLGTWYYTYENWPYAEEDKPDTFGDYVAEQIEIFPKILPYIDDLHNSLNGAGADVKNAFRTVYDVAVASDYSDPVYLQKLFDILGGWYKKAETNGDSWDDAFMKNRIDVFIAILPHVPTLNSKLNEVGKENERAAFGYIYGIEVGTLPLGADNDIYVTRLFDVLGGWVDVNGDDVIHEDETAEFKARTDISEAIDEYIKDLPWAAEVFVRWKEGTDLYTQEQVDSAIELMYNKQTDIELQEYITDQTVAAGKILFLIAHGVRQSYEYQQEQSSSVQLALAADLGLLDAQETGYVEDWVENLVEVAEILDSESAMNFFSTLLGMPTAGELIAMDNNNPIKANVLSYLFGIVNEYIGDSRSDMSKGYATVAEYVLVLEQLNELLFSENSEYFWNVFNEGNQETFHLNWEYSYNPDSPFDFSEVYLATDQVAANATRFMRFVMGLFDPVYGWIGAGTVHPDLVGGKEEVPKFSSVKDYLVALEIVNKMMEDPHYQQVFNNGLPLTSLTCYKNNGDPNPLVEGEQGEDSDQQEFYSKVIMGELFGKILMVVAEIDKQYTGNLAAYKKPLIDKTVDYLKNIIEPAARLLKDENFQKLFDGETFDTSLERRHSYRHRVAIHQVLFYFVSEIGIGDGKLYSNIDELLDLLAIAVDIKTPLKDYVEMFHEDNFTEAVEVDYDLFGFSFRRIAEYNRTTGQVYHQPFAFKYEYSPHLKLKGGDIEILLRNARAVYDLREDNVILGLGGNRDNLGNDLLKAYNGAYRDITQPSDQFSFVNETIALRPGTDEVVSRTVAWIEDGITKTRTDYYLDARAVYKDSGESIMGIDGKIDKSRLSPVFVGVSGTAYKTTVRTLDDDGNTVKEEVIRTIDDYGNVLSAEERELVTTTIYKGKTSEVRDFRGEVVAESEIVRRYPDSQLREINVERTKYYFSDKKKDGQSVVQRVEEKTIDMATGRILRIEYLTPSEELYSVTENTDFLDGREDIVAASNTYRVIPGSGLEDTPFKMSTLRMDDDRHPLLDEEFDRLVYDVTEPIWDERWGRSWVEQRDFFGVELRRKQAVPGGYIITDTEDYIPGFNTIIEQRKYVERDDGVTYDVQKIERVGVDEEGNSIYRIFDKLDEVYTGTERDVHYNLQGQPVLEFHRRTEYQGAPAARVINSDFIPGTDIARKSEKYAQGKDGEWYGIEETVIPEDALDTVTGLPQGMAFDFTYEKEGYSGFVYRTERTDTLTGYQWTEYRDSLGRTVVGIDAKDHEITLTLDFIVGLGFSKKGVIIRLPVDPDLSSLDAIVSNPQILKRTSMGNARQEFDHKGLPVLHEYTDAVGARHKTFTVLVESEQMRSSRWYEEYNVSGQKLETDWELFNLKYRYWNFIPGSKYALNSLALDKHEAPITTGRIETDPVTGMPFTGLLFDVNEEREVDAGERLFKGVFVDSYGNEQNCLLNIKGQTIIEVKEDAVIHNLSFVSGTEIIAESVTVPLSERVPLLSRMNIRFRIEDLVDKGNDAIEIGNRDGVAIADSAVAVRQTATLPGEDHNGGHTLEDMLQLMGLTAGGDYASYEEFIVMNRAGLSNILGDHYSKIEREDRDSLFAVLVYHPVSGKKYLEFANSRGQVVMKITFAPAMSSGDPDAWSIVLNRDYVPGTKVSKESFMLVKYGNQCKLLETAKVDNPSTPVKFNLYDENGKPIERSEVRTLRVIRTNLMFNKTWKEYYDFNGHMIRKDVDGTVTYGLEFYAGDPNIPIKTVTIDSETKKVVKVRRTRWEEGTQQEVRADGPIKIWTGRLAQVINPNYDINNPNRSSQHSNYTRTDDPNIQVTITDVENNLTQRDEVEYFNGLDQIVYKQTGNIETYNREFYYNITAVPSLTEVYKNEELIKTVAADDKLNPVIRIFIDDRNPADISREKVVEKRAMDHKYRRNWIERSNFFGQLREKIEHLPITDADGKTHSYNIVTKNYNFIADTEAARESYVWVNGQKTQHITLIPWDNGEYFTRDSRYRLQYVNLHNNLTWQEEWQIMDNGNYLRHRYDGHLEKDKGEDKFVGDTRTDYEYRVSALEQFEPPIASHWKTYYLGAETLISEGRLNSWRNGRYIDSQRRMFIQETNHLTKVTQQKIKNVLGNFEAVYDGSIKDLSRNLLAPNNFTRELITVHDLDDVAGYIGIAQKSNLYLYDGNKPGGKGVHISTTNLRGDPHDDFVDGENKVHMQEKNHVTKVVKRVALDNKGRMVHEYDGYLAGSFVSLNNHTYSPGDFVYRKVTDFRYDDTLLGVVGVAERGSTFILGWQHDPLTGKKVMKRIEHISQSKLIEFNSDGTSLIQVYDLKRPGLVWQELVGKYGAKELKYDGYLDSGGNFIRRIKTENAYAEVVHRVLKIASSTRSYVADEYYPGNWREFEDSQLMDIANSNPHFKWIDREGNIRISFDHLLRKLEWEEVRDNKGRPIMKEEKRPDTSLRNTIYRFYDDNKFGLYGVSYYSETTVDNEAQPFTTSQTESFVNGRVTYYIQNNKSKLHWREIMDVRGRLAEKYDLKTNEDGDFVQEYEIAYKLYYDLGPVGFLKFPYATRAWATDALGNKNLDYGPISVSTLSEVATLNSQIEGPITDIGLFYTGLQLVDPADIAQSGLILDAHLENLFDDYGRISYVVSKHYKDSGNEVEGRHVEVKDKYGRLENDYRLFHDRLPIIGQAYSDAIVPEEIVLRRRYFNYRGDFGKYDIPDRTADVLKVGERYELSAVSDSVDLDVRGRVHYNVIQGFGDYDPEIMENEEGQVVLNQIGFTWVSKAWAETRNHRGMLVIIKNGYETLEPNGFGKEEPRFITFLDYPEGEVLSLLGISGSSRTYENNNQDHESFYMGNRVIGSSSDLRMEEVTPGEMLFVCDVRDDRMNYKSLRRRGFYPDERLLLGMAFEEHKEIPGVQPKSRIYYDVRGLPTYTMEINGDEEELFKLHYVAVIRDDEGRVNHGHMWVWDANVKTGIDMRSGYFIPAEYWNFVLDGIEGDQVSLETPRIQILRGEVETLNDEGTAEEGTVSGDDDDGAADDDDSVADDDDSATGGDDSAADDDSAKIAGRIPAPDDRTAGGRAEDVAERRGGYHYQGELVKEKRSRFAPNVWRLYKKELTYGEFLKEYFNKFFEENSQNDLANNLLFDARDRGTWQPTITVVLGIIFFLPMILALLIIAMTHLLSLLLWVKPVKKTSPSYYGPKRASSRLNSDQVSTPPWETETVGPAQDGLTDQEIRARLSNINRYLCLVGPITDYLMKLYKTDIAVLEAAFGTTLDQIGVPAEYDAELTERENRYVRPIAFLLLAIHITQVQKWRENSKGVGLTKNNPAFTDLDMRRYFEFCEEERLEKGHDSFNAETDPILRFNLHSFNAAINDLLIDGDFVEATDENVRNRDEKMEELRQLVNERVVGYTNDEGSLWNWMIKEYKKRGLKYTEYPVKVSLIANLIRWGLMIFLVCLTVLGVSEIWTIQDMLSFSLPDLGWSSAIPGAKEITAIVIVLYIGYLLVKEVWQNTKYFQFHFTDWFYGIWRIIRSVGNYKYKNDPKVQEQLNIKKSFFMKYGIVTILANAALIGISVYYTDLPWFGWIFAVMIMVLSFRESLRACWYLMIAAQATKLQKHQKWDVFKAYGQIGVKQVRRLHRKDLEGSYLRDIFTEILVRESLWRYHLINEEEMEKLLEVVSDEENRGLPKLKDPQARELIIDFFNKLEGIKEGDIGEMMDAIDLDNLLPFIYKGCGGPESVIPTVEAMDAMTTKTTITKEPIPVMKSAFYIAKEQYGSSFKIYLEREFPTLDAGRIEELVTPKTSCRDTIDLVASSMLLDKKVSAASVGLDKDAGLDLYKAEVERKLIYEWILYRADGYLKTQLFAQRACTAAYRIFLRHKLGHEPSDDEIGKHLMIITSQGGIDPDNPRGNPAMRGLIEGLEQEGWTYNGFGEQGIQKILVPQHAANDDYGFPKNMRQPGWVKADLWGVTARFIDRYLAEVAQKDDAVILNADRDHLFYPSDFFLAPFVTQRFKQEERLGWLCTRMKCYVDGFTAAGTDHTVGEDGWNIDVVPTEVEVGDINFYGPGVIRWRAMSLWASIMDNIEDSGSSVEGRKAGYRGDFTQWISWKRPREMLIGAMPVFINRFPGLAIELFKKVHFQQLLDSGELHWTEKMGMFQNYDFYFNKPLIFRYNLLIFLFSFFLPFNAYAYIAFPVFAISLAYILTQAITAGGIRVYLNKPKLKGVSAWLVSLPRIGGVMNFIISLLMYARRVWSLVMTFLIFIPIHDEKAKGAFEGKAGDFTMGIKEVMDVQVSFWELYSVFRTTIHSGLILLPILIEAAFHPASLIVQFFFVIFPIVFIFGPFMKNAPDRPVLSRLIFGGGLLAFIFINWGIPLLFPALVPLIFDIGFLTALIWIGIILIVGMTKQERYTYGIWCGLLGVIVSFLDVFLPKIVFEAIKNATKTKEATANNYPVDVKNYPATEKTARGAATVTKTQGGAVSVELNGLKELNGMERKRLAETINYAVSELFVEETRETVSIIVSTSNKKLIRYSKSSRGKKTLEVHWAFLRSPPEDAQETEEERMLFLRGAMWHDMYHFLYPEVPESEVETRTLDHFRQHPDILEATIKVLRSDNPNWIYGEDWLGRLEFIQKESGEYLKEIKCLQEMRNSLIGDPNYNWKGELPNLPVEGDIDGAAGLRVIEELLVMLEQDLEMLPVVRYFMGEAALDQENAEQVAWADLLAFAGAGQLEGIQERAIEFDLNIMDAHVFNYLRNNQAKAKKVLRTMMSSKRTRLAYVVFDREDSWLGELAEETAKEEGQPVVVIKAYSISWEDAHFEDIARLEYSLRWDIGTFDNVSVMTSVKYAKKWRPTSTLNRMVRYIICGNRVTITGILMMYDKLPDDIREALGVRREAIAGSTVVDDERFSTDKLGEELRASVVIEISV